MNDISMNAIRASVNSGLYYKHITIVKYYSSIANLFGASLTDNVRVIMYNCHKLKYTDLASLAQNFLKTQLSTENAIRTFVIRAENV